MFFFSASMVQSGTKKERNLPSSFSFHTLCATAVQVLPLNQLHAEPEPSYSLTDVIRRKTTVSMNHFFGTPYLFRALTINVA